MQLLWKKLMSEIYIMASRMGLKPQKRNVSNRWIPHMNDNILLLILVISIVFKLSVFFWAETIFNTKYIYLNVSNIWNEQILYIIGQQIYNCVIILFIFKSMLSYRFSINTCYYLTIIDVNINLYINAPPQF